MLIVKDAALAKFVHEIEATDYHMNAGIFSVQCISLIFNFYFIPIHIPSNMSCQTKMPEKYKYLTFKDILESLSQQGRTDLAYAMTTQTTYPAYGYMILNNATTISFFYYIFIIYLFFLLFYLISSSYSFDTFNIWESWDFSEIQHSHNHPMFGAVSAWFYEYLLFSIIFIFTFFIILPNISFI